MEGRSHPVRQTKSYYRQAKVSKQQVIDVRVVSNPCHKDHLDKKERRNFDGSLVTKYDTKRKKENVALYKHFCTSVVRAQDERNDL